MLLTNLFESALRDKEDLQAKRKAIQDIQMDPNTHKDPELKKELARRKADLEKEAKKKGLAESAENLNIGDDVIITGNVQYNGATGVIKDFGRDNRFVIVDLYNHGPHSFHSSDVSYNDYADSDEEEADRYDRDEDFRDYVSRTETDEASDISGLLAANQYNKVFRITAELAEGGVKKFKVRAQSERVAREKFLKHASMAKILKVEDITDISESLADEFMKMAREKGYNPRLRGTPDEERARTDAMLKQRAADRAAAPKPAGPTPEERAELEKQLAALEAMYDPNYDYSDDYSVWKKHHEISKRISAIKKQLGEGLRDPKDNPCWKGYHPVGTKKKAGRTVPNCVPNANEGVAEDQLDEISQDTARSYAQKATQSKKDLTNQTYRKGADTDKLNKKIQNRQQGLNRAHTDKRYYKDELGVAEGSEQVYRVLAVDKSNALSKQVKLKVKASSLDEVFERLAINDWYPLEINGVEVINGKRLKQGVAEGSLEEMNRRGFLKGLAGAGAALAAGGAIAKGYNPIYAEKKKKEREEREKARPEQPGNHQQIPKPKPRDSYNSIPKEGVAEGLLNEGQYEMMMSNGQVKKFIAKDDADAKRIAAGHGAKSVIKLRGGVPAGKVAEQGVAEGKEDKIAQLKKDYDTAVHWSKNETSPQKREAARQKAEKIKRHLDTQYKQGVAEGIFGLTSKEKAKIQYVTAKISDIPGNWDHKNQQYTERGLADLKSVMKNEKYLKYALSLTSDDFEAEGVAEGANIVGQDSDLDQQVFTLNVDGKTVLFTYWDYENNFQSPDIKDIYQQAREQLGKKLSPEQIKAVARSVFKSFKQGVAEGEKVGNMDADKFDAAMARLKKLAGAGPLKTVWDPQKRVYKNVPVAQQPKDKK